MPVIPVKRSIIPACDMSFGEFGLLLQQTHDLPGIGGYKLSHSAPFETSWREWIDEVNHYAVTAKRKPIIYDGQKLGNDPAPHVIINVLHGVKDIGFDAAILYPFASPVVQYEVTEAAKLMQLPLIVGGRFTCPYHVEGEPRDNHYASIFQGLGLPDMDGYISGNAADRIYMLAAMQGVTAFSLPGNDLYFSKTMKEKLDDYGDNEYFAPGFGMQGGDIREAARMLGNFHAFVGRRFSEAEDKRAKAQELIAELEAA